MTQNLARTAGELRAAGHLPRGVKTEIRENLLAALREGRNPWPGIVGFDRTVLPQLERALLAGHDVVLLGERGQGKTRLLRTLVSLLDEWTPVIEGSELGEHPLDPITPESRRRAAELGDDLPVVWRHRDERYAEKLATPDTSVGDLVGDVMEERDIQVRGYTLRLPLDVLLVATANPEDYTNRGRIITPLKDRFGAEVRTHYPLEVDAEVDLVRQEADLVAEVGDHLLEIIARFVRHLRESSSIDQRSGVSARFAVAAAETVAASALRRSALIGETPAIARPIDLESVPDVLRGKLEFEAGEEGREDEVLVHLLRRSIADTARARLAGLNLRALAEVVSDGHPVATGDRVHAGDLLAALPELPILHEVAARMGAGPKDPVGRIASAVELALESLYLTRHLSKDTSSDDDRAVYG
ncbi:MAG: magnesium chelatase [Saccharothrix sp.]|nr:magnesium chelatase [Saccharothrix sp.]